MKLETLHDLLKNHNYKNVKRSGLLIGSAPSVIQLKDFKVEGLRIGIGDVPWRAPKFGPYDFWVASNGYYPLPQKRSHSRHIGKLCKALVFSGAFLQREVNAEKVLKRLQKFNDKKSYYAFDERHFQGKLCNPEANCCFFTKATKCLPTIQETLAASISDNRNDFPASHTVATYGLTLGVLLGLNPIFISGIELPKKLKDYTWYRWYLTPTPIHTLRNYLLRLRRPDKPNDIGEGFDTTLANFAIIVEAAQALGIKIYCLSSSSELLKVPGITYVSVAEANEMFKKA